MFSSALDFVMSSMVRTETLHCSISVHQYSLCNIMPTFPHSHILDRFHSCHNNALPVSKVWMINNKLRNWWWTGHRSTKMGHIIYRWMIHNIHESKLLQQQTPSGQIIGQDIASGHMAHQSIANLASQPTFPVLITQQTNSSRISPPHQYLYSSDITFGMFDIFHQISYLSFYADSSNCSIAAEPTISLKVRWMHWNSFSHNADDVSPSLISVSDACFIRYFSLSASLSHERAPVNKPFQQCYQMSITKSKCH